MLLLVLFLWLKTESTNGVIYNFDGHSYSLSEDRTFLYFYEYSCPPDWYPVDITNQKENDVLASVLKEDRFIGVEYSYWNARPESLHTGNALTYSNFKDPSSYFNGVALEAHTSKWKRIISWWDEGSYICESDTISPEGINITSSKIININPDDIFTFREHTYYIYYAYRIYSTARRICNNDHNGYIFIPNDGEENCAFHNYLKGDVYLGITNFNNKISTEKNYAARYLPWAPYNPTTKECVTRSFLNGEFVSSNCYDKKYVICETDAIYENPTYISCNSTDLKFYFAQIFNYNESVYYIYDMPMPFNEAVKMCEFRNAVLYVPRDEFENCLFTENVEYTVVLNYGEYYVRGIMSPLNTSYSNFTNWAPGYPVWIKNTDNTCVYQNYKTGKWENRICTDSRYACVRNNDPDIKTNAISNCKSMNGMNPLHEKTVKYDGTEYILFGIPMTFYEGHMLCDSMDKQVINPKSQDVVDFINNQIVNHSFYINNRITWDNNIIMYDDGPLLMTPNWDLHQPHVIDEMLACISINHNGTWKTDYCGEYKVPVCSSKDSTYTTSRSTARKAGMGVGIFIAIAAIVGISVGLFIFFGKKNLPMNSLKSFGSFRTKRSFSGDIE